MADARQDHLWRCEYQSALRIGGVRNPSSTNHGASQAQEILASSGYARSLAKVCHAGFGPKLRIRSLYAMGPVVDSGSAKTKNGSAQKTQIPSQQRKISHDGKNYRIIKEGLAEILIPLQESKNNGETGPTTSKSAHNGEDARPTVFYNPIQQYNRDLSVLAIKAFTEDLAAVRQSREEQNLARAARRGKKRKRGTDHDTCKRSRADDASKSGTASAVRESEIGGIEGSNVQESDKGNGSVPTKSSGVETIVENTEEITENGTHQESNCNERETAVQHNSKEQLVETSPPDAGPTNLNEPKGPKDMSSASTKPIRILDALSASGLRALRYAKEVPHTTSVVANDLFQSATASIKLNVAHNGLASRITTTTSDAIEHLHTVMSRANGRMPEPYHVIDLDPYGTAAPFLDAAVHAIADGGLLCITCTDAGIFASVGYLEKTFSQYGGLPLKGPHAHEAGLRLILHAIATSAGRCGIAIEPLLSLSIDFYARVFVRVHKSSAEVKFLASKTMVVYQCDSGCGSWSTQYLAQARGKEARNGETFYKFTSALGPSAGKECEHCGFKTHLAGPMWGGALHNKFFVQRILDMLPDLDREVYQTVPRLEGMLSLALEEDLDDAWASTVTNKNQPSATISPKEDTQTAAIAPIGDKPTSPSTLDPHVSSNRQIPPLPGHYRLHHPFFIHPPSLAHTLNAPTPSDASLRGALRHLGYRTSRSHTKAGSIITNAPFTVIWEIMREWARRERQERSKSTAAATTGTTDSKRNNDTQRSKPTVNANTPAAGIMKNDRSQTALLTARNDLHQRIERVDSLDALKRELQATLYSLEHDATTSSAIAIKGKGDPSPPPPTTTTPTPAASITTPSSSTNAPVQLHNLDIRFDERLGKDPARTTTTTATPAAGSGAEAGTGAGSGAGRSKKRMIRYQENPRENWGPMGRAKG